MSEPRYVEIGETIAIRGKKVKCVPGTGCDGCAIRFASSQCYDLLCSPITREDVTSVIFKEVVSE